MLQVAKEKGTDEWEDFRKGGTKVRDWKRRRGVQTGVQGQRYRDRQTEVYIVGKKEEHKQEGKDERKETHRFRQGRRSVQMGGMEHDIR